MCGAQEIYYTLNNRNEFNFMDALIMFLGAQEPQSNKTKSEEFANPTFFRDALYILANEKKLASLLTPTANPLTLRTSEAGPVYSNAGHKNICVL